MKFNPAVISYFFQRESTKRNLGQLLKFMFVLSIMVTEIYAFYHVCNLTVDPVLIIGSGRVGDAIADRFKERETSYLAIEKNPKRLQEERHYVIGDADQTEQRVDPDRYRRRRTKISEGL